MNSTRPPRRPGDLARGMAAVLLVATMVVGLPVGLLEIGADPRHLIPDPWPRWAEIDIWLERTWHAARFALGAGTLIPGLLLAVLWVTWLAMLGLVLAETIHQLRRGIHVVRSGVGPRRWIAGLVAAILIALLPQSALALPATGSTPVATALHDPEHPDRGTVRSSKVSTVDGGLARRRMVDPAVRPECPRVTVRPGDTMTSLAHTHLGDPRRYNEIHRLNADRIPNPDALYPGDVLLLPPPAPNTPPAGTRTVTVTAGETASTIAQREYGHHGGWWQLWEDNHDRPQPDGRAWTNPDQLRPGWQLRIRTPAPSAPPSTPPPATPGTPATSTPAQPSTTPTTPATASTPGTNISSSQDNTAGEVVRLPSGAIIGIGLAISVAITATTLRLRRRHRRRLTTTLEPPTPAPPLPPTVSHLERAAHQHGPLPPRRRDWPPPPAVLTAHTATSQRLTLDLAASAGLGLTGAGAAAAARAAVAAILAADTLHPAELLITDTNASRAVRLPDTPTQPPGELAQGIAGGVRCFDEVSAALGVLEAEVARRTRLLSEAELDADLPAQAAAQDRRQADPGEALPTVLVLATPEAATTPRLRTVLEMGRGLGIVGIVLGEWPCGLEVAADGLVTTTSGEHPTAVLGARLETLAETEAAEVLGVIIAARGGTDTTTTALPVSPAEVSSSDTAGRRTRPAPVWLQVFGPPRITVVGKEIITGLRSLSRDLLAYLATHPAGATAETLHEDMLSETGFETGRAQIHTAVSNIRSVLRQATGRSSAPFLRCINGRYSLDPDLITVDAAELTEAITQARAAATDPDRIRALRLVVELARAGAPLVDVGSLWAEEIRESLRQQALHALVRIAELLRPTDVEAAADALTVAITVDPYAEPVYQLLIQLYRDAGRREAAAGIYRRLRVRLADIDADPTRETEALVNSK
ncbi:MULTISPECIES: BTAD domain-containing putative transcriptional regulator [unclassified Crossiella]|uniref:BTAD domain-containing putative transcriptional regulator n=1 Tax=unclassified Crossiella TaxID=2620835 RepID=UPI0020001D88|nr:MULTISPECIES: BTAD domain-containing putative transcriptional regulator [unclassified Crossiella]MCK2243688.1 LysM peptidoglycan-binding domain-containing protein [Crossiella sp. S99.2]MCK2257547.1 LysM peptidoglycan-binding domain-containing protein [Crossiella sp. S99.1]